MAGARRVTTNITFGPCLSKPDGLLNSTCVSGVVIDIFPASGSSSDFSSGAGTYTATTNSQGRATILFDQIVTPPGWYYRYTYPAGTYDSNRPTFVNQYLDYLHL